MTVPGYDCSMVPFICGTPVRVHVSSKDLKEERMQGTGACQISVTGEAAILIAIVSASKTRRQTTLLPHAPCFTLLGSPNTSCVMARNFGLGVWAVTQCILLTFKYCNWRAN